MTELSDIKAALRREVFAARRRAHEAAAEAGPAAVARLLGSGLIPAGAVVSGYRPIRTEIDPTGAMTALGAAGHTLAVPVIEGKGLPLRFREWTPGVRMVEGPFGAEIPETGAWLTPAALIVPLVAFDRQGWRLGYGGGFYDRTLARLRAAGPVVAIGFAFAAQEVEAVPRDATDERLDAVVTERELIRIG